jgi:alpha-amylase
MPQICLYLQLHQPYRLSDFTVLDLGNEVHYFKETHKDDNKDVFLKVAKKSYLPMLKLLKKLMKKHPDFVCAVSCSGVFLEQSQAYEPEVITLLQEMVATKQLELLTETYYHSLAALFSPSEFRRQVRQHQMLTYKLFGVKPKVFRNTELVYSNDIAEQVADLGFSGMLTEAVPRYLHGRPKTRLYGSVSSRPIPLLLKHAELSDDVAFRFSDKNWPEYPLTVPKYLKWLADYSQEEIINLFMDFETFGEHQWESTGIFEFFAEFVRRFLLRPWNTFKKPSQLLLPAARVAQVKNLPKYDVPYPISWADVDRDLSAWLDNAYQKDSIRILYEMEKLVLETTDKQLQDDWRKLQTSDHLYYMCTKWAADGDVHAYFSPYDSPHEAYKRYSTVLADVHERLLHIDK